MYVWNLRLCLLLKFENILMRSVTLNISLRNFNVFEVFLL